MFVEVRQKREREKFVVLHVVCNETSLPVFPTLHTFFSLFFHFFFFPKGRPRGEGTVFLVVKFVSGGFQNGARHPPDEAHHYVHTTKKVNGEALLSTCVHTDSLVVRSR